MQDNFGIFNFCRVVILLYSSLSPIAQAVILKTDQIRPLQKVLENVGIHLQWGKFYYIAHYPPSSTDCYSYILPYNTPTKSARKCLYSFAMGEILLYSSLSPILDTPLIF